MKNQPRYCNCYDVTSIYRVNSWKLPDCSPMAKEQGYLLYCLLTMPLHFSMKLLCVSTRKSVRAVVHAPAPVVVGMRYSRGVSRVREGSRCFSSTLRRAALCACTSRGEGKGEGASKRRIERKKFTMVP